MSILIYIYQIINKSINKQIFLYKTNNLLLVTKINLNKYYLDWYDFVKTYLKF